MIKRLAIGGVIMAVAMVVEAQVGLSGRWQGESPNGSTVVFEVKATDTTLTGTLTVDGQTLPLQDGKVSKNTLSFAVPLPPDGKAEAFRGELANEELRLWIERRGPADPAILKRVTPK